MTTHTPGPWTVLHDKAEHNAAEGYYWQRVYTEADDPEYAPARAYGETPDEAQANARLIAQAPAMLAQLRQQMNMCQCNGGPLCPVCRETRALLRAVEG